MLSEDNICFSVWKHKYQFTLMSQMQHLLEKIRVSPTRREEQWAQGTGELARPSTRRSQDHRRSLAILQLWSCLSDHFVSFCHPLGPGEGGAVWKLHTCSRQSTLNTKIKHDRRFYFLIHLNCICRWSCVLWAKNQSCMFWQVWLSYLLTRHWWVKKWRLVKFLMLVLYVNLLVGRSLLQET